jgi:hypothetical protein
MRHVRYGVTALVIVASTAPFAAAQTTLTASTTLVEPGVAVSLTVTGPVGQQFAVIGSTVGSGFTYAGVPLAVGADVAIITTGVIGGGGTAVIGFAPPFRGATLDRYYVQAVTSPSAAFAPLQASAGVVLRNRDVLGPAGRKGSTGGLVFTLSGGQEFFEVTAPFVAEATTTCLMISSVQPALTGALPAGTELASVRNAVSRNGEFTNDGIGGLMAVSGGGVGLQPVVTRASVVTIGAGETVKFGVSVTQPGGAAPGTQVVLQTTYSCP